MADLGFIKRRPIATLLLCTTEPKREIAVAEVFRTAVTHGEERIFHKNIKYET